MAEEIKTGWIVVGGSATGGMVTPAKRLYAYIGTANIGGWYDVLVESQFSSRSGKGLDSDAVVARIRSMYRLAKELGVSLAEDELERFNATVARQREIVAKMRQKQEAEGRKRMREIKAKESRKPLVLAAEPGWKASFAGYVLGQVYPPTSKVSDAPGSIIMERGFRKNLDAPFHGMDFMSLSFTPTNYRLFRLSASGYFTGDRKALLAEGRALLKDIGSSMGIDLAPFKFEAPDGKYWPRCNMSGPSGPIPRKYPIDESQWTTSWHVFAFSYTMKGSVRIDVNLGVIHDKRSYICLSILDSEGEQAAKIEFDTAFRATHNGKSYDEWRKEFSSRRSSKCDDIVSQVRSSVSSVISALPAVRRDAPEYFREFGIRLKRYPAYQELVGIVSNNQETVCANFGACATNELSRMVLLAAWWGGDDTLYVNGLSNCLDMAMSGVVTRADLDWYRTAHFNVRRGNFLALRYDEPGMSNLVSRLYGFTGETNTCNRILSGEARISITNYLNEISHNK